MCFVEEVYPGAEIIVGDEDTQPLETPIIAPIKAKTYSQVEKKLPSTTFDFKFLAG
jgi:U5 small nuclear ribonucleoprotein component